jgi:tetratricopeptide (TPR) repeat protein
VSLSLAVAGALGLIALASPPSEPLAGEPLVRVARFWEARGNEQQAGEAWERALAADPANADAMLAVGRLRAAAGRAEEARALLDRLASARPGDDRALALKHALEIGERQGALLESARALVRASRVEEGLAQYRALFGPHPPPEHLALEYYETLGGTETGWPAARDGLERLAREAPYESRFALALGKHLTFRAPTRLAGIGLLAKLEAEESVREEAAAARRRALEWLGPGPESAAALRAYLKGHGDPELERRLAGMERDLAVARGHGLLGRREWDQAQRAFESAGPQSADGLAGLGLIALQREDFSRAVQLLGRAKALAPDRADLWQQPLRAAAFWSSMREARSARAAGDDAKAERALQAAARLWPQMAHHVELARVEADLARSRVGDAERRMRDLAGRRPEDPEVLAAFARLLLRTGKYEEAQAVNDRLARLEPGRALPRELIEAATLRAQAAQSRADGDLEAALEMLRGAARANPADDQTLQELVGMSLEMGDVEGAEKYVQRLAAQAPDRPSSRELMARILEAQGQYAEGLALLGGISQEARDASVEALRRRLRLKDEVARAVELGRRGLRRESRGALARAQRAAGDDPELTAAVAQGWMDLSEPSRAAALLERAAARKGASPGVRLQLGAALLRVGRLDELEAVLGALASEPRLEPRVQGGLDALRIAAVIQRADEQREKGDLEAANGALQAALSEWPENPRLLCALGRLFRASGQLEDAEAAYEEALGIDADDLEARDGAIEAAWDRGAPDRARALLAQARERRPGDPRWDRAAGALAERGGDDEAALRSYEEALARLKGAKAAPPTAAPQADAPPARAEARTAGPILAAAVARSPEQAGAEAAPAEPKPESPPELIEDSRALQKRLLQDIARVRDRHRIELNGDVQLRNRAGESGLGSLSEARLPVTASLPIGLSSHLRFSVTPTVLDAGRVSSDALAKGRFGSGASSAGGSQSAAGVAVGAEYRSSSFSADLGSTPLFAPVPNVIGGIQWRGGTGGLLFSAELSRRPVTDSLLSYTGAVDRATRRSWGGVVKTGGRFDVAAKVGTGVYYLFGGYHLLTGRLVRTNSAVSGGAGSRWALLSGRGHEVSAGLGLSGVGYAQNLSYYTLGHGGYFSPALMVRLGVPVRWEHKGGLHWQLDLEPGMNWHREEDADIFPLKSAGSGIYPGQARFGFAFNLDLRVGHAISPDLEAGLRLGVHEAQDYREIQAGIFASFALQPSRRALPSFVSPAGESASARK